MDFTSGEKRGLIALILLLALLCASIYLLRTCGKNEKIEFIEHSEKNSPPEIDSIDSPVKEKYQGKTVGKQNKRSKKEKNRAKDGAKRNYRDEYTD